MAAKYPEGEKPKRQEGRSGSAKDQITRRKVQTGREKSATWSAATEQKHRPGLDTENVQVSDVRDLCIADKMMVTQYHKTEATNVIKGTFQVIHVHHDPANTTTAAKDSKGTSQAGPSSKQDAKQGANDGLCSRGKASTLPVCSKVLAHNSRPFPPDLPLHEGCRLGLLEQVEKVLHKQAVHVNKRDRSSGKTALHVAAVGGEAAIVRALLKNGAAVHSVDDADWTPLHTACKSNHVQVTRDLVEGGADLNALTSTKRTPLHEASKRGFHDIVEYLLSKGASTNVVDTAGCTPLDDACREGHTDTVQRLLQAQGRTGDPSHQALFLAAKGGHADVALLLIQSGEDVNARDEASWRPLHHAAYNDHLDLVELLLDQDADINAPHGQRLHSALHGQPGGPRGRPETARQSWRGPQHSPAKRGHAAVDRSPQQTRGSRQRSPETRCWCQQR